MATGTAFLLYGASDRARGGLTPYLSMALYQDRRLRWQVTSHHHEPVTWVPRSPERVVSDALVLLVALTSTPRDPMPRALTEMAGTLPWATGDVDVSTWRDYDTSRLDSLVASSDPGGKLVLSLLPESAVPAGAISDLAGLDWDIDVLTASHTQRRSDPDLHQAPPAGLPGPALPHDNA